ncbi:hypothetical protein [Photobacterium angustum]|uniref:Uncharacterized protein n=1 Tax=Photobacterium angustum TaxID=661 RepID=A0A2S7VI16_PHOAN|nr:hypothetical protein [Photobacterium angustum]PQJ61814.1 hypothetical protein BTO08_16220 [Photobacterium angustum]
MKNTNKWDVCFNAYTKECTRVAIFRESLKTIGLKFKLSLLLSIVLFVLFIFLAIYSAYKEDMHDYYTYLFFTVFSECISIFLFIKAQSIYTEKEYSEYELSQAPPENYKDQKARYLKFRRTLNLNQINSSHIEGILEILNTRILINENSGLGIEKVIGVLVTFSISILVATMKSLDLKIIALIGIAGICLFIFIYILIKLTPNKKEKLYELKYFLTIFANEERQQ